MQCPMKKYIETAILKTPDTNNFPLGDVLMFNVGDIVDGKVSGITNFGAFIELPESKTGLVHISEISSAYVEDVHDFLTLDQEVKVKVLDITEDGKISLSVKKAQSEEDEQSAKPVKRSTFRTGPANVWHGKPEKKSDEPETFEEMMSKFKKISEDKLVDLKRNTDGHKSSYSRHR